MNNAQFADIIRIECKKKNIKLGELLEKCELNKGFISDLSRKNKTPSAESVIKIANFLNISTDYLLGRNAEPTQQIMNNEGTISGGIQAQNYNSNYIELSGLQKEMVETMEQLPKSEQLKLLNEAYKILERKGE